MFEYLPPLNDHNLSYPDTIHAIVVHFVIAMVLFAFFCDVVVVHGTLGAQLAAEFGVHNTADKLLRLGKDINAVLK